MKSNTSLLFSFLFIVGSLVSSCKKDDSTSPDASQTITSGSWKVSYLYDNSTDHTADFTNYAFTFNTDGTALVTYPGGSTVGLWSKDDSSTELKFQLGAGSPLDMISKNWTPTSVTATEIKLKDDSSTSEVLYLTKI